MTIFLRNPPLVSPQPSESFPSCPFASELETERLMTSGRDASPLCAPIPIKLVTSGNFFVASPASIAGEAGSYQEDDSPRYGPTGSLPAHAKTQVSSSCRHRVDFRKAFDMLPHSLLEAPDFSVGPNERRLHLQISSFPTEREPNKAHFCLITHCPAAS